MADYTPLDADDTVIPVAASQTQPSVESTGGAATSAPTLMDHDDEVIPVAASAQAPQQFTTQDQIDAHMRKLLDDPKVSGQQIRDFYTSLGGKLSEHDSAVIDGRDAYIAKNGEAPTIGTQDQEDGSTTAAPGLVDNRPYSFMQGVREGDQHVLSNIAGGAGWALNKLGLTNNFGDDARGYFQRADAADQSQGSSAGKLVGEIAASAPAGLIAAPIATAAGGGALATGLGMAADGAIQGALTTNSVTPGAVLKDAGIGGLLGAGFGGASHALANLASAPTKAAQTGRQILDAADRLKVKPLPADVGGAFTRGLNAAGEAGLVSNIPIAASKTRYLDSLQGVRDQAAASFLPYGTATKTLDQAADDALNGVGGLGDYEARSAEQGGKLYDNAAKLTGDAQVQTPRTLAAVNALIDQASRTPGKTAGLDHLINLRNDLTPGADQTVSSGLLDQFGNPITRVIPGARAEFAIDNLRKLRTSFGDNFDAGQRAARENAKTLWGPLSDDIQEGLKAQGRGDAADAYKAADQFWAKRQDNLDNIVEPILGNRSKEELADKFTSLSQNDSDLLGRGLDLMSSDQSAHVKAALIGELGKALPGSSNATNDAFSIAKFGTDWNKLSDGAKQHLLDGNEGDRLQDLARLAQGAKDANRYGNTSHTGRVAEAFHRLGQLVSGGAGYITLGKSLASEGLIGGALASPTVAQGLVKMGEIRPIAKSSAALAKLGQYSAPVIQNQ